MRLVRWLSSRFACWAMGHDAVMVPEGTMQDQPFAPVDMYYGYDHLCGRCGKILT